MKKNKKILMISMILLLSLSGCSQAVEESQPTAEQVVTTAPVEDEGQVAAPTDAPIEDEGQVAALTDAPVEDEEQVAAPVEGTGEVVEQAGVESDVDATAVVEQPISTTLSYKLSDQPYVSPSNAFSLNLPENWNCSETGQYRVDCYNTDNTALLSVRAIGTGYELLQEHFLSLVHAELVSTFGEVKAYTEISRNNLEGTVINEATWKEGETYWQGIDRFVNDGPGVYYLRIAANQQNFEGYRTLFEEFVQKAILNSDVMSNAPLYAFRKEYVSRELIFHIDVPTSWSKFVDASMDRTVVEGYLSPDQRASVQVAIFTKGSNISVDTKATKTREIMHDLYGWDMRITVDKSQSDGRERLEWYSDMKGIYGVTYFDTLNDSLYLLSIVWEDSAKELYTSVLQEIADSFEYE